ncbi:MAG: O-antigen ligase family protein [Clostridia bacterium]|nr:O-antigen ligase family protein [Clostridia bacterium]
MEKLKEKINVPNVIIAFIILQPIIDIITGISIEYAQSTITFGIIVRTIFMIFCVMLGTMKADKRYRIGMCIYYSVLLIYGIGFLVKSYIENGTNLIFIQMRGLVKNFYLPVMLVALVPIFRTYQVKVNRKVLTATLMIYAVTILICSIIGIALPTYRAGGKAGTVGLFYSANEIGAILCILSPFLIVDLMKRKVKIIDIIFLTVLIYAVLQVGTQVPYFSLIILMVTIIFACFTYAKLQKNRKFYQKAGMFLGLFVAIYLVTGITPVGENLSKNYGNIFLINGEDINFYKKEEPAKIEEVTNFEELTTMVVSSRTDYLKENKADFVNGDFIDKILGISFTKNDEGKIEERKLAEMDYFDILLCNGILGTILFAIPILTYIIILIRDVIAHKKKLGIEQIYVIVMASVVALLAGHVLVSPAVSIYIAIILLNCEEEVKQIHNKKELGKEEKDEEDNNISPALVGGGD